MVWHIPRRPHGESPAHCWLCPTALWATAGADFGSLKCYSHHMNAVKAKVVNGRFVIEEPTDLPEGTELYLVPVSEEDEDRLDVEEANKVLADMAASGKKPVSIDDIAARYGL